jgi:hypothetical protein
MSRFRIHAATAESHSLSPGCIDTRLTQIKAGCVVSDLLAKQYWDAAGGGPNAPGRRLDAG